MWSSLNTAATRLHKNINRLEQQFKININVRNYE